MKTVMKVLVVLVLSFIAVPGICPAQNVWKFNADSCRARALENNAAVPLCRCRFGRGGN